jgi:hypothetical protein
MPIELHPKRRDWHGAAGFRGARGAALVWLFSTVSQGPRSLRFRALQAAREAAQDHNMRRPTYHSLFGGTSSRAAAQPRKPPRQTTVIVGGDAIAAATTFRVTGEHVIAEAVRAARPDVRNVAVDLGSIRWTDPKTGRRVTFDAPDAVREALLALGRGIAPVHVVRATAGHASLETMTRYSHARPGAVGHPCGAAEDEPERARRDRAHATRAHGAASGWKPTQAIRLVSPPP